MTNGNGAQEPVWVVDDQGYVARPRDLHVAGVDDAALRAMQSRQAPLGFTEETWAACMSELRTALVRAGLGDADVRIRGSATTFFSGGHKRFPQSMAQLLEQGSLRVMPDDELLQRWQALGFDEGDLPHYHFFDSRYKLGLSTEPSDYDIQLSSDALATRIQDYTFQHPDEAESIVSPHGGHYRHEYVVKLFPELGEWAESWTQTTGRDVNIASFAGAGPAGSSRFADNDWRVVVPPGREEGQSGN